MNRADVAALETVARLEHLGVTIRSAELRDQAQQLGAFAAAHGNRAMRRAAERAQRRARR